MEPTWLEKNINEFIDTTGIKFIKGPFNINGKEYDYKLIDYYGEDYCMTSQMINWGVELNLIIGEDNE